MDTYSRPQKNCSCAQYLGDAGEQAVVALVSKGQNRQEAGIKAIFGLFGFLVCEALPR